MAGTSPAMTSFVFDQLKARPSNSPDFRQASMYLK
jgi:hypothetical protein